MRNPGFTQEELDELEALNGASSSTNRMSPEEERELNALNMGAPTSLPDIEVQGHRAKERIGALEAGIHGALQGLTFGFADEIGGGVNALLNGSSWGEENDRIRNTIDQARHDQPEAYTAGDVGGSIAGAFIPGVGLAGTAARGVGLGARAVSGLARGARVGAIAGGARGAGDGRGNLIDRAPGAAMGGAVGGAMGGVMGGAAPVMGAVGRGVNNATNGAVRMAGEATDNLGNSLLGGGRSSFMRQMGEPVDNIVDGGIDRLARSNPGLGAQAGDLYNNIIGGTQGMRGRAAAAHLTGGASIGAEGAARGVGFGLQGLGGVAGNGAVQGALAQQAAPESADPMAWARDPEQVMQRAVGTKWEQPLRDALGRGPEALRAQIFVLRNDPEFRQAVGIDLPSGSIEVERLN